MGVPGAEKFIVLTFNIVEKAAQWEGGESKL